MLMLPLKFQRFKQIIFVILDPTAKANKYGRLTTHRKSRELFAVCVYQTSKCLLITGGV